MPEPLSWTSSTEWLWQSEASCAIDNQTSDQVRKITSLRAFLTVLSRTPGFDCTPIKKELAELEAMGKPLSKE